MNSEHFAPLPVEIPSVLIKAQNGLLLQKCLRGLQVSCSNCFSMNSLGISSSKEASSH